MSSTLLLFVSVVGVLVLWWCLLIRGIPGLLRVNFERKATQIQRELDEAVVGGGLPLDDSSVEALSKTLEAVVHHSNRLTPAFSAMLNRALNEHGRPLQVRARSSHSFANLTADQRRLMHDLDGRLTEALTFYVKYGSVSGWLHSCRVFFRRLTASVPVQSSNRPGGEDDRRARPGDALTSTRLAMGALLDPEMEPGLEKPTAAVLAHDSADCVQQ